MTLPTRTTLVGLQYADMGKVVGKGPSNWAGMTGSKVDAGTLFGAIGGLVW